LDPNCKLFVNEYSGNSFGGYDSGPYVTLINNLRGKGAPIHAIGIQAHLANDVNFNPATYYSSVLQPLAVEGLPIWATEFDASHTNLNISADNIENFMRICFSHSSVAGIMFWGFMQNQMWRSNAYLVQSNGTTLSPQGVRYESLMNEWTTHDANYSDSNGKVDFRGFQGTYRITLSKSGETTEIHTIQLDPNTTTAYIAIDTNFIAVPDTNAPTPNPMTWAAVPAATGPLTITMTATTATDSTPPVQYYFECTTDGDFNSAWQSSPTYLVSGLTPSTLYTFRVKARDNAADHNVTGWSSTLSATTQPPDTTPPTPNPMTWSSGPTATGAYTITMTASTATDAVFPPVQYYFECTTDGDFNSSWQSSPTYLASGLTPSALYAFRVRARDSAPALNITGWSSSLSVTTLPQPSYISILGSWETNLIHAKEVGGNRALIFIANAEASTAYLNSVTYGGQTMTRIMDVNVGSSTMNNAAAFILKESGIAAASGSTFIPSWSSTPDSTEYASVFLSNVDQADPIGAKDSSSTTGETPNPITTNPIANNNGDMVFVSAADGNPGAFTLNNGFTEGADQAGSGSSGSTGVAGYKLATGVPEIPSATFTGSTVNRQVIIGFVIKVAADTAPAAPAELIATAGNKSIILAWNTNSEADINGYNVYRSATTGGGYAKLNISLLTIANYTDTGLTNGTPYYYVVTAVDKAGHESSNSSEKTATPAYQSCADALADGHRLAADINGSGNCYVDFDDLYTLASFWLRQDCSTNNNCDGADFVPRDGVVDFLDFSDLAEQWMTCNDPANPNCTPNW
jgi:hypothetical protein